MRYADDLVILCRSKRSSERVMRSITQFIEGKLSFIVGKEKIQIVPIAKVKFLGYSFSKVKGKGRLRLYLKHVSKLKANLRIRRLAAMAGEMPEERSAPPRNYWLDAIL